MICTRIRSLVLVTGIVVLALGVFVAECAHAPAVVNDCAADVTPKLTAAAAAALAGDDYEAAIAAAFTSASTCLVVAAVHAAIDAVRGPYETAGEARAQGALSAAASSSSPRPRAVEANGRAWLAAHGAG